jgi:hypothetical protein
VSLGDSAEELGAGETAIAREPAEGRYLLIIPNTESTKGLNSRPDTTRGGLRASQTAH